MKGWTVCAGHARGHKPVKASVGEAYSPQKASVGEAFAEVITMPRPVGRPRTRPVPVPYDFAADALGWLGDSPRYDLRTFRRFVSVLALEDGRDMEVEPFQVVMLRDHFGGALECLIIIPKKNGKSTLLAALALFHLCVTPDAECVIGAASRDQATILYDQAAGFVRRCPALAARVDVKRGYREIRSRRDSGRIRVLAADVDTADGVIPTLALVDELHRHKSAGLYGIFRDGLGPRSGQMVTISTAGEHEVSPLGTMRLAALALPHQERDGAHLRCASDDDTYVMHEWALGRDDDRDDMVIVKTANPASWQTLAALKHRHDSPSMLDWQWARFACGVWVAAEEWWVSGEEWAHLRTHERLDDGDMITLGFDGARTGDATALVGCRLSDGLLQLLAVWEAPDDGRPWEVSTDEVDVALYEAMETYRVVRGYFDPPLWRTEIESWAREYGELSVRKFDTTKVRMVGAVERFRTDVTARTLKYNVSDVLTRHVLNAQVKEARGGGYWLGKDRPGSQNRIDAAIAAVLAYEARADALAAGEAMPRSRVPNSW
jgi:phage terminase large subunit-like protein